MKSPFDLIKVDNKPYLVCRDESYVAVVARRFFTVHPYRTEPGKFVTIEELKAFDEQKEYRG